MIDPSGWGYEVRMYVYVHMDLPTDMNLERAGYINHASVINYMTAFMHGSMHSCLYACTQYQLQSTKT